MIRESIHSYLKADTKSGKELLKWAGSSQHTCDRMLVDNNGDLRALFDHILMHFKRNGIDIINDNNEDEEAVFYDFASKYDKGRGYWMRMGEKIFGDMWEHGVDDDINVFERFMIVIVHDEVLDKAKSKIDMFGWHYIVNAHHAETRTTSLIVSPVELNP